jgi:hypothetical protein|nr:MAG TPA: hypothetical protein [Caudoviricetes sp.]
MNYALIENEIVTNIIYLHPMNADEFPSAVAINNLPVAIGDSYTDGKFYRDGKEITLIATHTLDEANDIDTVLTELENEVGINEQ